jgi:hypothetical protein
MLSSVGSQGQGAGAGRSFDPREVRRKFGILSAHISADARSLGNVD